MTPTEKRIYALAQKWANEQYEPQAGPKDIKDIALYQYIQRTQCGHALLKLFQKGRKSVRDIRE